MTILAAPWTQDDLHDLLARRVAAFWWGRRDDEVAWALALCNSVNDPAAQYLYLMHATEDVRYARKVKEWAYNAAIDFVGSKGSGQRKRSLVESYRADWGHQAARDGAAMAMWSCEVPGLVKRAEQFKCGKQAYQRVRDEIHRQARDLIAGFRLDMTEVLAERVSMDFRQRWESVTGRAWA